MKMKDHALCLVHNITKPQLAPHVQTLNTTISGPRSLLVCRSDYFGLEVMGKASVQVHKHRREDGSASLLLCHCYDSASGAHALRVSCSLWVFNCTGLPIALRQSWLLETFAKQVCIDCLLSGSS